MFVEKIRNFAVQRGKATAEEEVMVEETEKVVEDVEEVVEALARGESVKISSFGSFTVRDKGQRVGRNPKTGQEVPILPRRVLVFRASNVLKTLINGAPGENKG